LDPSDAANGSLRDRSRRLVRRFISRPARRAWFISKRPVVSLHAAPDISRCLVQCENVGCGEGIVFQMSAWRLFVSLGGTDEREVDSLRELGSMNMCWKSPFLRLPVTAIVLAGSIMWMGAPPAQASSLVAFIDGLFGNRDKVISPRPPGDFVQTPTRRPRVERHSKTAAIIGDRASSLVPSMAPNAMPPARSDAASTPAVDQPIAAHVKATLSSSPAGVSIAPIPIGSASKINDLPVTPLE
jgi:hypothetical protein